MYPHHHQQSGASWQQQNQPTYGHPQAGYPPPQTIPLAMPFMNVVIGRPPFNLQIDCAPGIVPFVPFLISVAIAEIESKATANSLRTHMFNLYAVNGYQNERFVGFVSLAANYMELLLMGGRVQNEEQAARASVDVLSELLACDLVNEFQWIQPMLNPQMMQVIPGKLQQLNQIINDCQGMRQRRQGYGQGAGAVNYSYGAPQGGGYQPPGYGAPGLQGGQGRGFAHRGPAAGSGGGLQSTGGSFFNRETEQLRGVQQTPSAASAGASDRASAELLRFRRFSEAKQEPQPATTYTPAVNYPAESRSRERVLEQPFRSRVQSGGYNASAIVEEMGSSIDHAMVMEEEAHQASNQEVRQAPLMTGNWGEPVVVQDGNIVRGSYPIEFDQPIASHIREEGKIVLYTADNLPAGVTWKSTKKQPYHPAWNPFLFKLHYVFDQDGDLLATILPKTESEMTMMEHSRHVIGRVPTQPDRFPKTVNGEVEQIKNYADAPADVSVVSSEKMTMDVNEEVGAINAHIEAVITGALSDANSAVRKNILVAEPLPCDNAAVASYYRTTIQEIANSGNFDDAARILRGLDSPQDLLLFNRIDALLTAEINRVLKVNLMLTAKIGSFTEDAPDLHGYLRGKYGDDVAKALSDQQARLLKGCLGTLDEEETLEFQNNLIDQEDEAVLAENASQEEIDAAKERKANKPTLAFLSNMVTYTFLSTYMFELALAKSTQAADMLTQEYNPNLYQIAVDLFNDDFVKRNNIRRHYFVTKDGVKFEITRGYLNKVAYIIALV